MKGYSESNQRPEPDDKVTKFRLGQSPPLRGADGRLLAKHLRRGDESRLRVKVAAEILAEAPPLTRRR